MIKKAIAALIDHRDLTEEEMIAVMEQIMTGGASPAQIGAFLVALRMKGETIDEITGAARVMRAKALSVDAGPGPVVDTCGTGGDGLNTFNISTTAAFIASGAGLTVAKHGNRSVSSACGSADVLRALGVNIEAEVAHVERCLKEARIGFLFAPIMHSAMKHAIGPRREIGARTVFNILGPLTNPAGAPAQVIGVFDGALAEPLALTLARLGARHVLVVHGSDGLDEITVTGPTRAVSMRDGQLDIFEINPGDFGFPLHPLEAIRGGTPEDNARILRAVLDGQKGAPRDVALLNAGAAIWVGGLAGSLAEGVVKAAVSVDSGAAKARLEKLLGMFAS